MALNLLNLLPVWPLDGGRICWILFSLHSPLAQTLLSASSLVGACFLFLAPRGGWAFLIVMALLLLAWAPSRYRHARAALAFAARHPAPPDALENLSERQVLDLYRLTETAKPDAGDDRATDMRLVYARVARLPRSSPPFRSLLIFVLLWAVALGTAAGTSLQDDARKASVAVASLFDWVVPE